VGLRAEFTRSDCTKSKVGCMQPKTQVAAKAALAAIPQSSIRSEARMAPPLAIPNLTQQAQSKLAWGALRLRRRRPKASKNHALVLHILEWRPLEPCPRRHRPFLSGAIPGRYVTSFLSFPISKTSTPLEIPLEWAGRYLWQAKPYLMSSHDLCSA
jgi:hypothetical protein